MNANGRRKLLTLLLLVWATQSFAGALCSCVEATRAAPAHHEHGHHDAADPRTDCHRSELDTATDGCCVAPAAAPAGRAYLPDGDRPESDAVPFAAAAVWPIGPPPVAERLPLPPPPDRADRAPRYLTLCCFRE